MPTKPLSIWHPFTQEALDPQPVHIERGEGVYLYTRDGRKLGKAGKNRFIALEHAYHGDTAGAMSVGADSDFVAPFQEFRFPVLRAPSAYCFRCPVGKQRATCDIDCTEPLARLLEERHDEIAAVIAEPLLQGAGGMIVHPVEFLQRLRSLCTQFDVLLIADDVLTGVGRCRRKVACDCGGLG